MMQYLITPQQPILGYYYWAKTVDNLDEASKICNDEDLVYSLKKAFPYRKRRLGYYKKRNTKLYIVVILVSDSDESTPYPELEERFNLIVKDYPRLKDDIKVPTQQIRDIFNIPG